MKKEYAEIETRFGRIEKEWPLTKQLSLVCCDGKEGRSLVVVVDHTAIIDQVTKKPEYMFLTYCSSTEVEVKTNAKQTAIWILLKQEERSNFVIDLNYLMIHYRPSSAHMVDYGLLH